MAINLPKKKRPLHSNRWSTKDLRTLRILQQANFSARAIAAELGRSPVAIYYKAREIGAAFSKKD